MQQLSLLDFVVDKNKPKNVFVLGNGESRDGYDLKQFRQWGKIYGCNALYRDFQPDGLISTDWAMMHEVYSSGYCSDTNVILDNGNCYQNNSLRCCNILD